MYLRLLLVTKLGELIIYIDLRSERPLVWVTNTVALSRFMLFKYMKVIDLTIRSLTWDHF